MTPGLWPNALTLLRLLLVAPVLGCIAAGWNGAALALFVLAGLTDALDGYLARRLDARTALGATLDPLADKVLLTGVYLALAAQAVLPLWLAVLVVGRDVGIVCGAAWVRLRGGAYAPRPTRLSRVNTATQVTLASAVLAAQALAPGLSATAAAWLVPPVAATTVLSGLEYVWTAARRGPGQGRGARRTGTGGG